MNHPDLLSLTYTSSATSLLDVTQLVELVEEVRAKNERLGITGLLLYSGGNVIQTIEGPPEAVDEVYGSISVDPRHGEVRVVDRRRIDVRAFPSWSMGFRNVSAREVADLQGFDDFARQSVGQDLGPHAAFAFELLRTLRVNTG